MTEANDLKSALVLDYTHQLGMFLRWDFFDFLFTIHLVLPQRFQEHDLDYVYDPKKEATGSSYDFKSTDCCTRVYLFVSHVRVCPCSVEKMYKPLRALVAKKVVSGFSVAVFTYGGQDKSKTESLMGNGENMGVAGLMIKDIFVSCAKDKKKFAVSISMKLVEICDEKVQDLLGENPVQFGSAIGGCVEMESHAVPVQTPDDALSIARNAVMSKSVRMQGKASHVVQVIQITAESLNKKRPLTKMGKLTLVDTTDDAHLAELKEIVKVQALHQRARESSKKSKNLPPMPRRRSPLTRLMAEAIGGNCKTVMLLHTYPSDPLAPSTMEFASHLKSVENDSIVNVETAALKKLKQQLAKLVELQEKKAGGGGDDPWWSPSNLPSVSRPGAA